MKTYLVTGGAGFIGSHFIKYLGEREPCAAIINVDNLTYAGDLKNLKSLEGNRRYLFIKEDITNREGVNCIFHKYKPDYVVNFAAESHVDRSINDCGIFIGTNVYGTQVLLQASVDNKIEKFVQISTDEVYGSLNDCGYFTEESPVKPRNPYSASKAGADMLAMAYNNTYGLPVCITRCTNNYGPNQNAEKFIPKVIKSCLDGSTIPIYGDGRNIRDWIHVYDNCSAVYAVLKQGEYGSIYNIGANNEWDNTGIACLIIKKLKLLMNNIYGTGRTPSEDLIEYVEDRKGHDRRYAIDSTKLRNSLGWQPVIDFDQGLSDTIKWYIYKWH